MGLIKRHEKTVREFAQRAVEECGPLIDAIVLYGSVAKGKARRGSDIDVFIIYHGEKEIADKLLDISCDIDLKNSTVTNFIENTPEEVERSISLGSPFIEEVLGTGVAVYDNGTFQRLREKMLRAG